MAETDILNPQTGYWAALGDNPNPSYGFTRKTNSNALLSRTRMGSWAQRDNANAGYSFPFAFVGRPWSTMLRLKQFYEIGKRGYFTYIDYDGGSRNHVGRFTSEPNPVEVANGKYSCQNLIFEEIPQARMLTYPADFANWSATLNIVDDFLRIMAASKGAWTLLQVPGGGFAVTNSRGYTLRNAAPAAGDFAQMQYVGWGFQTAFVLDAAGGQADLYLDGQLIIHQLDFYNGSYVTSSGYTFINPVTPFAPLVIPQTAAPTITVAGGSVSIQMAGVPLDVHRVKLVPLNTKNASSTGVEVYFNPITVIV